jgi:hypothetical protein
MSPTLRKTVRLPFLFAVLCAALAASSHGQTLADLADSQRAKQQIEMLKIRKDLETAEIADKLKSLPATPGGQPSQAEKKTAQAPAQPVRPRVVLHALYTRDNVWVAEIASEQRLAMALPGMKVYGQTVTGIEQRGLLLNKPCTAADVRAKAKCGQRVVRVGEAI